MSLTQEDMIMRFAEFCDRIASAKGCTLTEREVSMLRTIPEYQYKAAIQQEKYAATCKETEPYGC